MHFPYMLEQNPLLEHTIRRTNTMLEHTSEWTEYNAPTHKWSNVQIQNLFQH